MTSKNTGLTRLWYAFGYSAKGIAAAWSGEAAFRQEIFMCLIMVPLGFYLGENGVERALLASSVILVPIVELINSAIESVVDRIGLEKHKLSGKAKDMGSAAVLLTMFLMICVWASLLLND